METAVNYFAVFGGLDVKIDTSKPLGTLIKRHILSKYYDIQDELTKLLKTDHLGYKILSGVALGDRRINSAFKRADVEYDVGIKEVHSLVESNIISEETSFDHVTNLFEENNVADKLIFTTPFLRFWFAFVSPVYRGVKREEYDEVYERFDKRKDEFVDFVFESLCHDYIDSIFTEDKIEEIGRFWSQDDSLELIAQTEKGKIIVGSCKYSNQKIKKNELNRLKEICSKYEIVPDYVVLFSKKGFSSELKSLKNDGLKLFTVKSLKALLSN